MILKRYCVLRMQVIGLLAGYTGALFAFYSLVPHVLNWSGAAILNLSLLSSNLWAALARNFLLGGCCSRIKDSVLIVVTKVVSRRHLNLIMTISW